jgi:hypothetical protein
MAKKNQGGGFTVPSWMLDVKEDATKTSVKLTSKIAGICEYKIKCFYLPK